MSIRHLLSILAIAMCSAIGQTTTTTSSTRAFDFPLVGLGSTETAEINVVNTASNPTSGTAASCTGTLSFTNAGGTTIGSATAFTLASGVLATAKLPFSTVGGTPIRTQIRAVVTLTPSTATPRPPCSLEVTFATYDTATGATHVFLGGAGETLQSGGPHGR